MGKKPGVSPRESEHSRIYGNVLPGTAEDLRAQGSLDLGPECAQIEAIFVGLKAVYRKLPSAHILRNLVPPLLDLIIENLRGWSLPLPLGNLSREDQLQLMTDRFRYIQIEILERHFTAIQMQSDPCLTRTLLAEIEKMPFDSGLFPKTRAALDRELIRNSAQWTRIENIWAVRLEHEKPVDILVSIVERKFGEDWTQGSNGSRLKDWGDDWLSGIDPTGLSRFFDALWRFKRRTSQTRMNMVDQIIDFCERTLRKIKGE